MKIFPIFMFQDTHLGLGNSSVGKMFVTQHEDLPPKLIKEKLGMAVCAYNHNAGEAEIDGSLGLTYQLV